MKDIGSSNVRVIYLKSPKRVYSAKEYKTESKSEERRKKREIGRVSLNRNSKGVTVSPSKQTQNVLRMYGTLFFGGNNWTGPFDQYSFIYRFDSYRVTTSLGLDSVPIPFPTLVKISIEDC